MQSRYRLAAAMAAASLGSCLLLGAGCPILPTPTPSPSPSPNPSPSPTPTIQEAQYQQTNLVSDGSQTAAFTDTKLVNPWGLIQRPDGPFWVGDNGTGFSTVYNGAGQPFPTTGPLVVTIPVAPGGTSPAPVTGVAFNPFSDTGAFGAALFLFVTEDGTVASWQPSNGTTAVLKVNGFKADDTGPVYKGATVISNGTGDFLLAADFRDARIAVFNTNFRETNLPGGFADSTIPIGFAPFNVLALHGKVYVSYAKQDDKKHDDVAGVGNGFVNEFDNNGMFLRRIASNAMLNSPWGMAIAPSSWGSLSGSLLIGNFGDGMINAFSLGATPNFLRTLKDTAGNVIVNPGLWSLVFGDGAQGTDPAKVYLTAGGQAEDRGLFASIQLVTDVSIDTDSD